MPAKSELGILAKLASKHFITGPTERTNKTVSSLGPAENMPGLDVDMVVQIAGQQDQREISGKITIK